MTTQTRLEALEAFVSSDDLRQLEALAYRFNLWETLGIVRSERCHSNFLAFLLDPQADHGFRDEFLKLFLQKVIHENQQRSPITSLEVVVSDFHGATVELEQNRIDILISDQRNNLYILIENKVDSDQHSDQLARYFQLLRKKHPLSRIIGIYLTKEGDDPENESYLPFSHAALGRTIRTLLQRSNLTGNAEVRFALTQYADMLGRHFMADDQIKTLCRKIYSQHKDALQLILDNRPNARVLLSEHFQELISEQGFELDKCTGAYVRFLPKALDFAYFKAGDKWTPSKRLLLFEFQLRPQNVVLIIQMGPGDQQIRKEIHKFAVANGDVFQVEQTYSKDWQMLFKKVIVEDLESHIDEQDLLALVDEKWEEFLSKDLPNLSERLSERFGTA